MLSQNLAIAIPAIEVWTAIATEDSELESKSLNVIHQVYENLIIVLLQNLVRQPEEEDVEGKYWDILGNLNFNNNKGGLNIQESTIKCLMMVVEVVKDEVVITFQNFISSALYISSRHYKILGLDSPEGGYDRSGDPDVRALQTDFDADGGDSLPAGAAVVEGSAPTGRRECT